MSLCPSPNQERDEDSSGDDLYEDAVRPHRISAGNGWPIEQLIPPLSHEIEFRIQNVLKYEEGEKVRSPPATFGSFRCRVLVFPMGTRASRGPPSLAAFVEADPLPEVEEDPRWLFSSVKYSVALINHLDYSQSVVKTDTWSFSREGIDRGWHSFVSWKDLTDPTKGWMRDGAVLLRAQVYVRQGDTLSIGLDYDARKETGYVGLRNHGATCYLNGLLQSLYLQGKFREMVYSIDCLGDENTSLVKALQNVLYQLQTSTVGAVNCRELMKSFGWDSVDAFQQHDAQELNRILLDRLEEKLKGTKADGKIKSFFEGEFENYIQCTEVDYCSKRDETFYDLQLNVRAEGGRSLISLEESFRDFCREEILEHENAYDAGPELGKQRAKKGIRFKRFPPVLNLQLKRFTFDLETLDMVKLNDKLEFPTLLNLEEFCDGAATYLLAAVVVHTGTVSSGHYYAFARPMRHNKLFGKWLKFDDESVSKCTEYRAVQDNFGGEDPIVFNYFTLSPEELERREFHKGKFPTSPRIHNAYILTYVREDMAYEIMRPPEPPVELVSRFSTEAEAKERQRHDQQTKVTITILLERDLMASQPAGFWDAQDTPPCFLPPLEMSKDHTCKELWSTVYRAIRDSFGFTAGMGDVIVEQNIGIFVLRRRNNRQVRFSFLAPTSTIRSNLSMETPSSDGALKMTILVVTSIGYNPMTLKWEPETFHPDKAEAILPADDLSAWKDEKLCLVLLKYFDPLSETVTFLGCLYGHYEDETHNIRTFVERRIQLGLEGTFGDGMRSLPSQSFAGVEWLCWEEFSSVDIRRVNLHQTMKNADLYSGDILVWQVHPGKLEETKVTPGIPVECKTVGDLAAKIANKVVVRGIVHSLHEPLCIEGVIGDGIWIEDTERVSPRNQKEEIEMDLRWNIQNAFNLFSQKFDIPDDELWVFRTAPACVFDDPWLPCRRSAPARCLKDMGWSAQRRPTVHLVRVPMCSRTKFQQMQDADAAYGKTAVCVRFFDDHVREVGNCILTVNAESDVREVMEESIKCWTAEPDNTSFSCRHQRIGGVVGEGLPQAFRELKLENIRVTQCHGASYNRSLDIVPHDLQIKMLSGMSKANILYNCLRVEPRVSQENAKSVLNTVDILCYHAERQGTAFGHPFFLEVRNGDTVAVLKEKIQKKLLVPNTEYRNWRICRVDSPTDTHPVRNILREDEKPADLWTFVNSAHSKFWLEHSHPTLRPGDSTPKPRTKPRGLVIR
eukprot:GEMP01000754.1.p1 GENE.GEMP01000754.1~~GEMP01000754.1.p1  ORF type:complete len:1240 (+),score=167.23 GEMP01000754.1:229-3948(+)